MATAANGFRPDTRTRSGPGERTGPAGWVLRALVSAHVVVILGQPVFAGVYLSGDFDGLRWHALGANIVTSIGYVQVIAAATVWFRLRRLWPLSATLAVVAAETVQYFAGLAGALWLHLPLGVATVAGLVVLSIVVWIRPMPRRPRPASAGVPGAQEGEGHA
ncbi:hypothetical protein ACIGZJ_21500 [Kitasatospora sp. NPDC052868]|uniref:hypothetical protein n=1 Tax=Kitasatospora sp. NPDC052868 TaxID=3364060 RepID=UPI0037C60501